MAKKDFKTGLNALLGGNKPEPSKQDKKEGTAPSKTALKINPQEAKQALTKSKTETSTPSQKPAIKPATETKLPDNQPVEKRSGTWSHQSDLKLEKVAQFKKKTKTEIVQEAIDFYLKFQVEVD